jgi:SAM-dependent methyltransferase
MKPAEFAIMQHAENTYWWYQGMAAISRSILERINPHRSVLNILDGGCGAGMAKQTYLAEHGCVTGVDYSAVALSWSAQRSRENLAQASVTALPFKTGHFDLISSFDVLSDAGVSDDRTALAEFYRVLQTGGRIFLRLPAFEWLSGVHDREVATQRRYTAQQVTAMLQEAGFSVEYATYVNFFLFPWIAAKRWAERLLPGRQSGSDLKISLGWLDNLFLLVLLFEAWLVKFMRFPWGVTVLVIGRK